MRVEIAEIKPRQKYSLAKIAKLNTGKVYGNAISAWGIEQRGSHFGSFSFLCSTKVAGGHFITQRENPPALYDIHAFSPGFSGDLFIENLCTAKPPFQPGGHNVFHGCLLFKCFTYFPPPTVPMCFLSGSIPLNSFCKFSILASTCSILSIIAFCLRSSSRLE